MTAYELSKLFIGVKKYTKTVITTRVNAFYMVDQLTEQQYRELIALIEKTYAE